MLIKYKKNYETYICLNNVPVYMNLPEININILKDLIVVLYLISIFPFPDFKVFVFLKHKTASYIYSIAVKMRFGLVIGSRSYISTGDFMTISSLSKCRVDLY